jgi:alpha-beta hydrolase superfamily lysophospholipase
VSPTIDRQTLPDGHVVRTLLWPAAADTLVLVQHGLGEHGGRYASLAEGLGEGHCVASFDSRGHGYSAGTIGDAESFDQLADDLHAILPVLLEASGCRSVVLYGHSMGGAVVGHYLTRGGAVHDEVVGVVLSAPAVAVSGGLATRVKVRVGKVLHRVAPTLVIGNSIPTSAISSDPAEEQRYVDDPLVHDRVSLRLGNAIVRDGARVIERASSARWPLLLVHGDADPIIPLSGSQRLLAAWGSESKQLLTLAGGRHESHHEVPALRQQLFERVRQHLAEVGAT